MNRFRIFLFCLLSSGALFAADLNLIVQSPSGDRVSGVQVTLYRASDNAGVGILTTTGDGVVNFSNLADGAYKAEVLAPGFAAQTLPVTVPQTAAARRGTEARDHCRRRWWSPPPQRPTS